VDGFAPSCRGYDLRTGGMNLTEHTEEQALTLVDLAQRLDTQNMVDFIRGFVGDLRAGFSAVDAGRFPWLDELKNAPWSGVLCLGMGGSAAGGDFLSTLSAHGGGCPIIVHRDYTLPSWFDGTWLVLATSYSGNTEETVQATQTALAQGATAALSPAEGNLPVCRNFTSDAT